MPLSTDVRLYETTTGTSSLSEKKKKLEKEDEAIIVKSQRNCTLHHVLHGIINADVSL